MLSEMWDNLSSSPYWGWIVAGVAVLAIVLVAAVVRWLLTHDVREKLTRQLVQYYRADATTDGTRLSERDRDRLTSACIRVWRTPHGYLTHVTRRLAYGLTDDTLRDAAMASCPPNWRHHVRHVLGSRWIVSDGRKD